MRCERGGRPLDEARSERARLDVTLTQHQMRRQALVERARADYRATPEDILAAIEPDWTEEGVPEDLDALEGRIADLRARLESMGPVNLVAIEEYQEHEQRHDFLVGQQNDLVAAKDQLIEMIRTINQTTLQLFSETFTKVNENFREMFTKLFGGGTAHLVLVDEGDVLESGIEIVARPPGKKPTTVSLLSGGERTMTAVALLFALYMVKPSPFCVLDELDAALDDSNIGRFVSIVQGFLEKSQFIVITHNRQTIAASNVLYGVTMEKSGISKMVSVRFNTEGRVEHGREAMAGPETTAAPDATAPAEPEPVG
jgi:chromosome segregation protein